MPKPTCSCSHCCGSFPRSWLVFLLVVLQVGLGRRAANTRWWPGQPLRNHRTWDHNFFGGACALSFNKFFTRYFPARNWKAFVVLPVFVQNLVKMTKRHVFFLVFTKILLKKLKTTCFYNFLSESCRNWKNTGFLPCFAHYLFLYWEKSIFLCFIAQYIAKLEEKQRVSIVIGPTSYRKKPSCCSICPKIPWKI